MLYVRKLLSSPYMDEVYGEFGKVTRLQAHTPAQTGH